MRLTIGYLLGGLAVALIVFAIWVAAKGGGGGLVQLLAGFALLLGAVGVLRSSDTLV